MQRNIWRFWNVSLQRLKKLIEDLIEASKASSGSLSVNLEKLEAGVFLVQTVGEFKEKTEKNKLDLQIKKPEEPIYIMADGRHFWRVIDNLMNNICKYAQPENKSLYQFRADRRRSADYIPQHIQISAEHFQRGTDGAVCPWRQFQKHRRKWSGLVDRRKPELELMHGKMQLFVDGDLFKVVLEFDRCEAS